MTNEELKNNTEETQAQQEQEQEPITEKKEKKEVKPTWKYYEYDGSTKTKKLIIDKRGKKYLIAKENKEFGNDLGVSRLDGVSEGNVLPTHKGDEFYLVEPTAFDIIKKMKRSVTTLLPKDIGLIIAYCGIENGETVVEAGTGSAGLTMYLSQAVGKEGKVITYEKRPEFAKIARRNLEIMGSVKLNQPIIGVEEEPVEVDNTLININEEAESRKVYNVIQKIGDITEGIEEQDVDVIVLDMPDPWNVVPHAKKALNKAKGRIAVYVPYIEQSKKAVEALKENNFLDVITIECILREMDISEKGVRPSTRMIGHTGYLTFARVCPEKLELDEE
ncbi:tRNA (adenine-N1)-methyltransferase [Methanococcus voltae]|uniref:tRNA (Adenine-N(1)-)-methyltransferase n=1 Tax=Methanococcus voltae (strain ATCC BAA-1334 / A3) TaxID=456320 RepID=D7DS17_METV3|nr:tRNA (adenine-N1)-methyltransferase [Methanococcus voltae]MCS3901452.1 tRNA (adenine57-N1/adenine58-N1)-methyltransferase [Methanococcus voltae]